MSGDLEKLQTRLGYRFSDPALLRRALTHPSLAPEDGGNQRLEFLGDAVLGLVLANQLYHKFPDEREGVLARRRASLASGTTLMQIARQLEIEELLEVSAAEAENNPKRSNAMLEDALEAVLGAVYLDGDLAAAEKVIAGLMTTLMDPDVAWDEGANNPKGTLQEHAQSFAGGLRPNYTVVATEGPDHDRRYTVEVQLGAQSARGRGSSRKLAEVAAARALLEIIAQIEADERT